MINGMMNKRGKANDVDIIYHKRKQIEGEKVYCITQGLKMSKSEKRLT
jgi:hypothetical protein